MQRYFIKFSYMGTHFRGLQRQPGEILDRECPYKLSIQTLLERGLERFNPVNKPTVQFSSRTDQNVHALCNTAHFDLQHPKEGSTYSVTSIVRGLNRYLEKCNASIFVREVTPVPPDFSARHSATSRHYLYRLGVARNILQYPMCEWKRCYFISEPFCLEKAKETCKIISSDGQRKNFASFCHNLASKHPNYSTTRAIERFDIGPGRPLLDPQHDPLYRDITFLDIHVKGQSFMYKQVRRMVGVLIAVAQNRMSLDEVNELFERPGVWNSKAITAAPHGLYLIDVEYQRPNNVQPE